MAKCRALDQDDDFTFGQGLSNYKNGQKYAEQHLATRLRMFLGECFFDLIAGPNWVALMQTKDTTEIALAVSSSLLNSNIVTNVNSLTVALSPNRNVLINYDVTTVYSQVTGTLTL